MLRRLALILLAGVTTALLISSFFGVTQVKAATNAVSWPPIGLKTVATGLASPIDVESPDDGTGRLFILEKGGIIRILDHGNLLDAPFLDISGKVASCNECGLLGLAFPPDFTSKGYFFIDYINNGDLVPGDTGDPNGSTDEVVARYHLSGNANVANANSEEKILVFNKPAENHNGGHILFGPDGFLYLGTGDGGGGGDTYHNGQDRGSLLGKILRIQASETGTYTIPATNPFTTTVGVRPEIWMYGLRNPWRYGFDRSTGDLYIADVGQNTIEEVNHITATDLGNGGFNFGWNIMEGDACYPPSGAQSCNRTGLTLPVATYHHDEGCSITGGFVYHSPLSGQKPVYLYGDYCSGRLWGLQPDGHSWATTELRHLPFGISSFGNDSDNNVYVVDYAGTVYRVDDSISGLTAHNDGPTPLHSATALSATITPISFGSDISYTWDFGDGSAGTGKQTTHTYNQAGIYTATVTAINAINSETATTRITIEAPPPPPPAVEGLTAGNDSPAEVGTPVGFTATVTAGTEISDTWDFGDGNAGDGVPITHSYDHAGIYTATVAAVNAINSETATITVYVGDAVVTVKDFAFTPQNVTIANGGTVIWVLKGGRHSVTADGGSFRQPPGDDWPPFVHTFTQSISNTVASAAIVATDSVTIPYHCEVSPEMVGSVIVQVASPPPPAIGGLTATNDSPALVTTPISFTVTVTTEGEISYTWTFGDNNQGSGVTTTHAYDHVGIYTATVTATNASSVATATTTVYVGDAIVNVLDNFYNPAAITVAVGSKVIWVLRGSHPHSVTADDGSFEQARDTGWSPFIHTFSTAGSFDYRSVGDAGMVGNVTVADGEPGGQGRMLLPRISLNAKPADDQ